MHFVLCTARGTKMNSGSVRSALSAVLLRRYVLLLGSCNVVAAAKLQPVASGSAGYSTRPYPAKVQKHLSDLASLA